MTSATARVPAKINLSLGVGPIRDDGYHALATVYQALDVYDEVRAVAVDDSDDITVSVHIEADRLVESIDVPTDDDNLAVKAARLLRDTTGAEGGVRLAIRKVIPVAGGMAGGSADAAGALVACNEMWGSQLSRPELEQLAPSSGSDVPFLLHGGNAIGGGRGETISPVLARGSYFWVVGVASQGLARRTSTPSSTGSTTVPTCPSRRPRTICSPPCGPGTPPSSAPACPTTSPTPPCRCARSCAARLDLGLEAEALGAVVSGSGPTCLFLAEDEAHSLDIAMALAGAGVCADVIQARGPVAGAKLI